MRVVFVSNYINHHQLSVSSGLLALCEAEGGSYTFIQTEPMEEERVRMGWSDTLELPTFVKNYWEEQELCDKMILEADGVIFGGLEREEIITPRLQKGLPVLRYSERLYKTGRWKFISPRGLKKKYQDHTRYGKQPVYLLCAGAYVAGDFRMVLSYPFKKYRYGYFPPFRIYSEEELFAKKPTDRLELLWAARMIGWKHPETALSLARDLKKEGVAFTLRMLGDGTEMPKVRELIRQYGLEEEVKLAGFCNPEETRNYMEQAHIYLATSDRQEGWGAVINEAMNSGCVVLANRAMGSAPYLIEDGVNGILYRGTDPSGLYRKLLPYVRDENKRQETGKRAYERIAGLWNAEVAAKRLYAFLKAAANKEALPEYPDGPLSKI